MGFFTSGKGDDNEPITSILDKNMQITGDVTYRGKARVDGRIEGNVSGEYLVLSEAGIISGDVEAETVICHGRIDGNVKAAKFNAKETAVITGRIEVEDLSVDFGASLSGEIKARAQDLRLIKGSPGSPVALERGILDKQAR